MSVLQLQLSLEFLIFIAVSLTSITISIFFFSNFYSKLIYANNKADFETFISGINEALQAGAQKVLLYVPKSICYSNLSGDTIRNDYGEFETLGKITISSRICNNSGKIEEISIEQTAEGNVSLQ